jgi:predicted kinase
MKKLIIMRAAPGGGKSFIAEQIQNETISSGLTCSIRSTDNQFYIGGKYIFDRTKLGMYHNRNLQYAIDDMKAGINIVIIDNTNIKPRDYKGYVEQAVAFGYDIEEKKLDTPLQLCLERNSKRSSDRKVPDDIVERMWNDLHA